MQSNQLAQTIRWVNGWKSINNGVTTGGLFWLGASRSISRVARALVYRAGSSNPPVLQARTSLTVIFTRLENNMLLEQ